MKIEELQARIIIYEKMEKIDKERMAILQYMSRIIEHMANIDGLLGEIKNLASPKSKKSITNP